MPNIFGANIAKLINKHLGSLVFDQTLIKAVKTQDPADSTKVLTVETEHACKGFIDEYKDEWVNGTTVKVNDRKIVILGDSLPTGVVPEPGDKITAEETTFTIVKDGVKRDPAAATYECQSK